MAEQRLYVPPDARAKSKCAFDWDIYKDRKSALQYLRKQLTLVDIILETEDGSSREYVHKQVMSAFGDKLTQFIESNGTNDAPASPSLLSPLAGPTTTTTTTTTASTGGSDKPRTQERACHQSKLPLMGAIYPDLYSSVPRKPLRVIRLPKVNAYTLNVLIECAYTGYVRTDLSSGGIWQVLEVADFYQMSEVIRACCSYLDKNLTRENCVHFYHIGSKHKHALQHNAWHKIRAEFKYILRENLARSQRRRNVLQAVDLVGSAAAAGAQAAPPPTSESNNELRLNNLATIKFEHLEPLLAHDKLNIDNEESVWYAIKLWCAHNASERVTHLARLLNCLRLPRFKQASEFCARQIWRDPLIVNNREAQHELALLDRNQRELLGGSGGGAQHSSAAPPAAALQRDGFNLPCALRPRQLRPRVPHSVLLAIGGWQQGHPTKLVEAYDSNCNLWFESERKILTQLAYHGVENIDNQLYICGGTDGAEILNELFVFDPLVGECRQKASMREARCYVSTAHLNGFLYALGGHNGVQRMRSVERFDLKNELWLRCQDMNAARSDASACVHAQLIYIAGGLNDQVIEASVEFYNFRDQSWTYIQPMLTPRTSFTLISYNNSLLAIGGNNGQERLSSVEVYQFEARAWAPHSEMRNRRSTFSAALLDESKLIVVGGYNGHTPFAQVEMLDLSGAQSGWQPLQRIRYDRSGLKLVVVKDLPNASDYTFVGAQKRSAGTWAWSYGPSPSGGAAARRNGPAAD